MAFSIEHESGCEPMIPSPVYLSSTEANPFVRFPAMLRVLAGFQPPETLRVPMVALRTPLLGLLVVAWPHPEKRHFHEPLLACMSFAGHPADPLRFLAARFASAALFWAALSGFFPFGRSLRRIGSMVRFTMTPFRVVEGLYTGV